MTETETIRYAILVRDVDEFDDYIVAPFDAFWQAEAYASGTQAVIGEGTTEVLALFKPQKPKPMTTRCVCCNISLGMHSVISYCDPCNRDACLGPDGETYH